MDRQGLEEALAHLTRVVEDLSAEVSRQGGEVDVLTRRVRLLMERAAEAEADGGGSVVLGDERPPHY